MTPEQRPKMWQKQRWAYRVVKNRGLSGKGTGVFMEMGTGKSRVVIHAIEQWMAELDAKLILVTNILTGLHVWVEEWHNWATFPVLFIDLHEMGVEGLQQAKRLAAEGYPVICLVNYEMAWQIGHKRIPRIRNGEEVRILEQVDTAIHDMKWDLVVLDESTAIKSPASKVTKYFLKKVKPNTKIGLAVTGSAYTKRPLDVYPQLKFVLPEGSRLIPSTFTAFKQRYSIPHPYIRGAILGYQNIDELVSIMSKCCVLLKKEDVLDLPPALHLPPHMIVLPPKVRKVYDEVTDELFSELEGFAAEGKTITVNHIFAVMRKQMQITSGFVRVDSPDGSVDIVELHDLKLEDLGHFMENRAGKPTVIVTQADYEEVMISRFLRKHFKYRPKVLNGSVKGAQARHQMVRDAAKDPAFIVKEAVGAKSVDMRWSDMIIFYSHNPNTINYDQILSRNHRGGQTKKITYGHILCKKTVDTRIMKILENDLDMAREIERQWRLLLK